MIWMINGPSGVLGPDTSSYTAGAKSLLHGSFLNTDGEPEIYRTPGYPIFLMPAVAGRQFGAVAIFENMLLALFCAWLIYQIASDILPGSQAAWWAVIFYCFEFSSLLYSVKALSETLFCTQFVLFVWLLLRFFARPTFSRLILCALALGWATYTRPVGVYFGLFLSPLLLFLPRNLPLRQRTLRALVFPVTLGLCLGPWILRNVAVGDYAGFAPVSSYVLYFFSAPAVKAKLEGKGFLETQLELGYGGLPYIKNEIYLQKHPEQREWSQGRITRFWDTESRKIIAPHLGSYALIHFRGCVTMLLDPAATELLKVIGVYPEQGGLLVRTVEQGYGRALLWLARNYPSALVALLVLGAQLALYYGVALAGLRWMSRDVAVVFLLLTLWLLALSGGPAAVPRYRTPMMPLVCIAAGVAVACWRKKKNSNTAKDAANLPPELMPQ
jgi:4-amino-4-deoxy-L-arabinose transferase-like glycosyltransferase